MFPEVFDLEYTKMKFWKAEEFVFSKSMNVTPKKMPVFAMCYQQDYPLKMAKWMQFPLLSPIKVVTEVDPNKFVIVNFRVAIKKKKTNKKHNKPPTKPTLPILCTNCELNSPEIAQHLIPVTQIIVSWEWSITLHYYLRACCYSG